MEWRTQRVDRLNELEEVHRRIAGTAPGRKWLTEELDRSYVVVLASQFQGFCRDLHSEAVAVVAAQAPALMQGILESSFTLRRYLDRGNPTPGNIGSDFARFGFDFWDAVYARDARNGRRRELLDQVMIWRNAIAHDSPVPQGDRPKIVGTSPTLTWGRRWRRGLSALAPSFDRVLAARLQALVGNQPW